jgi:hypothetical protein
VRAAKAERILSLDVRGDVHPAIRSKVEERLASVPAAVQKRLRDEGVKVVLVDSVPKQFPGKVCSVRSWAEVSGYYSPFEQTVVLNLGANDPRIANGRVVFHEIGHAITFSLGIFSSQEFEDAYQADLDALSPQARSFAGYYINHPQGRREVAAAAFAHTQMPPAPSGVNVEKAFPRALAVVKQGLQKLEAEG